MTDEKIFAQRLSDYYLKTANFLTHDNQKQWKVTHKDVLDAVASFREKRIWPINDKFYIILPKEQFLILRNYIFNKLFKEKIDKKCKEFDFSDCRIILADECSFPFIMGIYRYKGSFPYYEVIGS